MIGSSDTFPELVKEVRRQLGISQEELAHELGGELCHYQSLGKRQDHAVQTGAGAV
jgi:transcriptional regulator with XRE-family HTH domain